MNGVLRNILTFVFIVKSSSPNKTFIMLEKKVVNHCSNPFPLFFKWKNKGAKRLDKFFKVIKLVSGLG